MNSYIISPTDLSLPDQAHSHCDRREAVSAQPARPAVITGIHKKMIQSMIWINLLFIALRKFPNPRKALQLLKQLKKLRDNYRSQGTLNRYQKAGNRFYFNYNAPGWPSAAFNRYAHHVLSQVATNNAAPTLHTLVFAITKKCGFKCEHCCEWENLNQPEQLSREDLLYIVRQFDELGISQVQFSGGEPLNRFDDIIYLLDHLPLGIDAWIYTTGYQLTREKAQLLKKHGLTGITLSIDHHDAAAHDLFRGKAGSFDRAMKASGYAVEAGLLLTYSICATRKFISTQNLDAYAEMARANKCSFIQVLEPKAVGHYAGADVLLLPEQLQLLESFYTRMNYSSQGIGFPTIAYHGYYSRRMGCSGSGKDYLYVDTDGDVHNCPFCQRKLFSSLNGDLSAKVKDMKRSGCTVYNGCSILKDKS